MSQCILIALKAKSSQKFARHFLQRTRTHPPFAGVTPQYVEVSKEPLGALRCRVFRHRIVGGFVAHHHDRHLGLIADERERAHVCARDAPARAQQR